MSNGQAVAVAWIVTFPLTLNAWAVGSWFYRNVTVPKPPWWAAPLIYGVTLTIAGVGVFGPILFGSWLYATLRP